jgi:hypothetical protein
MEDTIENKLRFVHTTVSSPRSTDYPECNTMLPLAPLGKRGRGCGGGKGLMTMS